MAQPHTVPVAVAVDGHDLEAMVGQPGPAGHRQCPAVDRVEAIHLHIVRQLAAATNAGKDNHLVRRNVLLGQGHLDRVQDAIVATSLTPGARDGAVEIFTSDHCSPLHSGLEF
jgi:hypothetical protein